jgi:hypothetical protein
MNTQGMAGGMGMGYMPMQTAGNPQMMQGGGGGFMTNQM